MKRKDDAAASRAGIARLDAEFDGAIAELVKINARMVGMEERLASLFRERSERIIGRLDAFLSKLETYGRETTLIPHALDEHGKTLKDHERRLVKLERP